MLVSVCFVCALQKNVKIKYAQKNLENIFIQKPPEGTKFLRRGPTRGQGALVACPLHGRATWPPGGPPGHMGGHLLAPPFAYNYVSSRKHPRRNPFLETYLCSAAVAISISGGDRHTCPDTLPEEEDHPGGLNRLLDDV